MTPRECPQLFECPKVWEIMERYEASQWGGKVKTLCAVCHELEHYSNGELSSNHHEDGYNGYSWTIVNLI